MESLHYIWQFNGVLPKDFYKQDKFSQMFMVASAFKRLEKPLAVSFDYLEVEEIGEEE